MALLRITTGVVSLMACRGVALISKKPPPPGWKPPVEYEQPDFAQNVVARLKANMQAALAAKGFGPGEHTLESLQDKVKADNAMMFDRTEGGLNEVRLAKTQKLDYSHGIRYSRSNLVYAKGVHVNATIDRGCSGTDEFGATNCTFVANDQPRIKLTAMSETGLEADSTVNIRLNMRLHGLAAILKQQVFDKKVKSGFRETLPEANFTCPVCGTTCKFSLYGMNVTQDMPPCPIVPGQMYTLADAQVQMPKAALMKMLNMEANVTVAVNRPDGSVFGSVDTEIKIGASNSECPQLKMVLGRC